MASWIKPVWKECRLSYRIKNDNNLKELKHTFDIPQLQFLFEVKKELIENAFKEDLEVRVERGGTENTNYIRFDSLSESFTTKKPIKRKIKEVLKRVLLELATLKISLTSVPINGILDKPPTQVLERCAVIFSDGEQIVCVAENNECMDKLLVEIGHRCVEIVDLKYPYVILQDLGVEEELNAPELPFSMHPHCEDEYKCVFKLKSNDKTSIPRNVLDEIVCTPLKFNAEFDDRLIFDQKGSLKENFLIAMRKRLKGSTSNITFGKRYGSAAVYARNIANNETFSEIAKNIENAVKVFRPSHDFLKSYEGGEFCREWDEKGKLFLAKDKGTISCTDDVYRLLYTDAQLLHGSHSKGTLKLDITSPLVVRFLGTFGSDVREEMRQKYNVKLNINGTHVYLEGPSESLQNAKQFCKESILRLRRSLPIPAKLDKADIIKVSDEISQIAEKNKCCWKVQNPQKQGVEDNVNYDRIWVDPLKELNVCIQSISHLEDIETDILIELTQEKLFPLTDIFHSKNHPILEKSNEFGKHGRSLTVGEVMSFNCNNNTCENHCKYVYAICALEQVRNGQSLVVISNEQLKEGLQKALSFMMDQKCHSLAISTKTWHPDMLPELEIVQQMLAAAFDTLPDASYDRETNVVLYCNSDNMSIISDKVDEIFQNRKGFKRIPKTVLRIKVPPIRVQVVAGNIVDAKAAVIVNTVNKSLDLTKGQVSKMIAQKAGEKLQKECSQKYPEGIQIGQVAYTGPYELKDPGNVKYLFHSALPFHEKANVIVIVKKFVKRCLYLADRLDCKSVAFPAVGVGQLKYPRRETASAMLEAIEEYKNETAMTNVQEVKIFVYEGDKKACQSFFDEHWKRNLKYFDVGLEDHASSPHNGSGKKLVKKLGNNTRLEILPKTVFGKPSTYAVQLCTNKNTLIEGPMKCASSKPETWNDQMYICESIELIGTVNSANLAKIFKEERITEAVWFTDASSKMPCSSQVGAMLGMLESLFRQHEDDMSFVSKFKIITHDETALEILQTQESGLEWSYESGQQNLSVELVGKSENYLDLACQQIGRLLTELEKRAELDERKENAEQQKQNVAVEAQDEHLEKTDDTQENLLEVSATLNSGIVAYMQSRLKDWKKYIEENFHVTVILKKNNDVEVFGCVTSVTRLESFLNKRQFLDMDILQRMSQGIAVPTVTIEIEMNIGIYTLVCNQVLTKFDFNGTAEYKNNAFVLTCPIHHSEHVKNSVEAIFNEVKMEQIFCKSEEEARFLSEQFSQTNWAGHVCVTTDRPYFALWATERSLLLDAFKHILTVQETTVTSTRMTKGNVQLHLEIGDMQNVDAEFIIVPSCARIRNEHGLGNVWKKMLGEKYVKICEESIRKNGEITEGECRVIRTNLARRQYIGHIRLPRNSKRNETQRSELCRIKNALVTCFKEAISHSCTDIALSCVGSDTTKSGFGIRLCASEYYRAVFDVFKWPSNKSFNVHIVDSDKEKMLIVTQVFQAALRGRSGSSTGNVSSMTETSL
ncbi:uncharacterized protein LOC128211453 isoform X2 [Mya arenaria]|nr:uncharacterized protein LOC128211453 isoform X2 [Mya arenaria]XP_052772220.1 uncharacterized protein LOC128211453 isoform X2 [Mya arenaria]